MSLFFFPFELGAARNDEQNTGWFPVPDSIQILSSARFCVCRHRQEGCRLPCAFECKACDSVLARLERRWWFEWFAARRDTSCLLETEVMLISVSANCTYTHRRPVASQCSTHMHYLIMPYIVTYINGTHIHIHRICSSKNSKQYMSVSTSFSTPTRISTAKGPYARDPGPHTPYYRSSSGRGNGGEGESAWLSSGGGLGSGGWMRKRKFLSGTRRRTEDPLRTVWNTRILPVILWLRINTIVSMSKFIIICVGSRLLSYAYKSCAYPCACVLWYTLCICKYLFKCNHARVQT